MKTSLIQRVMLHHNPLSSSLMLVVSSSAQNSNLSPQDHENIIVVSLHFAVTAVNWVLIINSLQSVLSFGSLKFVVFFMLNLCIVDCCS